MSGWTAGVISVIVRSGPLPVADSRSKTRLWPGTSQCDDCCRERYVCEQVSVQELHRSRGPSRVERPGDESEAHEHDGGNNGGRDEAAKHGDRCCDADAGESDQPRRQEMGAREVSASIGQRPREERHRRRPERSQREAGLWRRRNQVTSVGIASASTASMGERRSLRR